MPRKILILAAALLLSGCADNISGSDDGRWLVTRRAGETDYEMRDGVLFPYDSAQISPRAFKIIQTVALDAKRRRNTHIEVQGFIDTRGTHDYNMVLSQARAERVAGILVQHGVAVERILARGYGEASPRIKTRDGVKEPRNRLVVIRIMDARSS